MESRRFPVSRQEFLRITQETLKYRAAAGITFAILFFTVNELITPERLGYTFRVCVLIRFAIILALTFLLIQTPILVSRKLNIQCPNCGIPLLPSYRRTRPITPEGKCAKCDREIVSNPM